jgi:hypothetical protein
MTTEKEVNILSQIYTNVNIMESTLQHILEINKIINKLDNNYFDSCNTILIQEYINKYNAEHNIQYLQTLKEDIVDKLSHICEHEWIHDSIDIDTEHSQNICYCVKCEITKK